MKKVISLLLITVLCFVLTGCGSEKAMTTKKFTETMSKEGYQLNDISEQYKNNQLIDQAVVASKEHHQIELYISKDAKKSVESLHKAFHLECDEIAEVKGTLPDV